MFCPNCGNQMPDEAMFCGNCGWKKDDIGVVEYTSEYEEIQTFEQPIPNQQPHYQQHQQNVYVQQSNQQYPSQNPGQGFAVAAMVLGILTIVVGIWIWYISLTCAILGVIFGIVSRNKSKEAGFPPNGMATAGIVLSLIGLAIAIIIVIACASCLGSLGSLNSYY